MKYQKQSGAILLFCLILLIVMTVVSIGSMDTSNIEQKMAGNARDYNLAFQAADSVIRDAETVLHNNIAVPITSDDGSSGIWTKDELAEGTQTSSWWESQSTTWWETNGTAKTGLSDVSKPPRYIIEEFGDIDQGKSIRLGNADLMVNKVHRITTRGVGTRDSTAVLIQTTFEKEYER